MKIYKFSYFIDHSIQCSGIFFNFLHLYKYVFIVYVYKPNKRIYVALLRVKLYFNI